MQRQWKLTEMVELSRKACLAFPGNLGMLCELARSLYFASSLSADYTSKKLLKDWNGKPPEFFEWGKPVVGSELFLDEAIGICKKII